MYFDFHSHLEKSMDQSVVGISGYKLSVTVACNLQPLFLGPFSVNKWSKSQYQIRVDQQFVKHSVQPVWKQQSAVMWLTDQLFMQSKCCMKPDESGFRVNMLRILHPVCFSSAPETESRQTAKLRNIRLKRDYSGSWTVRIQAGDSQQICQQVGRLKKIINTLQKRQQQKCLRTDLRLVCRGLCLPKVMLGIYWNLLVNSAAI